MRSFFLRVLSIIVLSPIVFFLVIKGGLYFNVLLFIIFFLALIEILKLKKKIIRVVLYFILILFSLSAFTIRNVENGLFFIIFLITICWLSDIGGYIFGRFIGGKKIKIISPNKTFIGFFGSLFLSQFSFLLTNFFFKIQIFSLSKIFSIQLIGSVFVIIGDLFFSYIKRLEKIKDYSNIIPGHGGLLDRIDGMIFLVIFFSLIYKILL